jgi:flagellin-specific chaperone FliS
VDIVLELGATLNIEAGGELTANMADGYDYPMRQLMRANGKPARKRQAMP